MRSALTCLALLAPALLAGCATPAPLGQNVGSEAPRGLQVGSEALRVQVETPVGLPTTYLPDARLLLSTQGGVITLANYEFRCAHPSVNDPNLHASCLNIPVVVLWVGTTGQCEALAPYNTLRIITKKQTMNVSWTIIGPANAAFDPSVESVKISPTSGPTTMPPVSSVYDPGNIIANGRTYMVRIKPNAPPAVFSHDAHVKIGSTLCKPVDPLIINVEN